jgi:nucleoside-diphosphate-sugar epimerase
MRASRTHLVIGAGPVGSGVATALASAGDRVVLVTRSGSGPDLPGVERVTADAADAARLAPLAAGAASIVNAVNPPYHRWAEDWPRINASVLEAAEGSGALLVTVSNLYGYGPGSGVMGPDTPLAATGTKGRTRAAMWEQALAAHRAGRLRATEVRGGDYVGPMVTDASMGERVVPNVIAGKKVQVVGDPDVAHSFAFVPDVVATIVAAIDRPEVSAGAPWIAPVITVSQREMVAALASAAGRSAPKVGVMPWWVLRAGGVAVKLFRELMETRYQWDEAFVADDRTTAARLGVTATPLAEAAAATVAWYRAHGGSAPGSGAGIAA